MNKIMQGSRNQSIYQEQKGGNLLKQQTGCFIDDDDENMKEDGKLRMKNF